MIFETSQFMGPALLNFLLFHPLRHHLIVPLQAIVPSSTPTWPASNHHPPSSNSSPCHPPSSDQNFCLFLHGIMWVYSPHLSCCLYVLCAPGAVSNLDLVVADRGMPGVSKGTWSAQEVYEYPQGTWHLGCEEISTWWGVSHKGSLRQRGIVYSKSQEDWAADPSHPQPTIST